MVYGQLRRPKPPASRCGVDPRSGRLHPDCSTRDGARHDGAWRRRRSFGGLPTTPASGGSGGVERNRRGSLRFRMRRDCLRWTDCAVRRTRFDARPSRKSACSRGRHWCAVARARRPARAAGARGTNNPCRRGHHRDRHSAVHLDRRAHATEPRVMTPLLDARGLAISGRLQPTDLELDPGMTAVIGPNGAGKTSLLRALAGIELEVGDVVIAGEDLTHAPSPRRMRLLSFLPATRALVWPISTRDVIALGLPSPDPARVDELLKQLELDALADRPVDLLSTGERSRVLLARALAARPRLLLLDEPLSNLDPYWVLRTLQILNSEAGQSGCAVLASLHDLNQIGAFERVLLVDGGRVVADGSPTEVMDSPVLARAFRIEKDGRSWKINEEA